MQRQIEYRGTGFGETIQVRFKLFMEDCIAGFDLEASGISRLFVPTGKYESCIRSPVENDERGKRHESSATCASAPLCAIRSVSQLPYPDAIQKR
jgi:hypothetical protein